jgi:hypothetical protein
VPRHSTADRYPESSQETEKDRDFSTVRYVAWEDDEENPTSGGLFERKTNDTTGIAEVIPPYTEATTAGTDG